MQSLKRMCVYTCVYIVCTLYLDDIVRSTHSDAVSIRVEGHSVDKPEGSVVNEGERRREGERERERESVCVCVCV